MATTYESGDLRKALVLENKLWAVGWVLVAMGLLYWRYSGSMVPDWLGYSDLYDYEGGWLMRQGRDPLFVAVLHLGRSMFGIDGYTNFRLALFGLFALVAARAVFAATPNTLAVAPALIVVAAFLLKSLVQIREGMAFALVVWSLITAFQFKNRHGWLIAGVGCLVAALIHAGAVIFVVAWALALGLHIYWPLLKWRDLPAALLALGLAIGVTAAWLITRQADAIEFALRDLGEDTTIEAVSGGWKYAYWIANGGVVLLLRHQLLQASEGSMRFGYAYAGLLGSLVIPMIYACCVYLVFSQFYLPAVTAMAVRLLFSASQLGLIIIAWRGRITVWTMLIVAVSLADQIRLLYAGISPAAG